MRLQPTRPLSVTRARADLASCLLGCAAGGSSMKHLTRWNRLFGCALAMLAVVALITVACSRTKAESEVPRGVGQTVHDAAITAEVKIALAFEPGVSAMEINVDTDRGVVTLRGEVGTEAERQLAVKVAEDAAKVKEVV